MPWLTYDWDYAATAGHKVQVWQCNGTAPNKAHVWTTPVHRLAQFFLIRSQVSCPSEDCVDRLRQASGDQVPAGQVHCGGPGQHLGQRALAVQGRLEGGHLLAGGKPSSIHVTSLECEAASRRRVPPGKTGWARLQCPAEPAETA